MAGKGKISLLLGVAAGAVTGMLFAPNKGKALRDKIAKERKSGGFGHKVVAKDLAKMADDISVMAQDVAKSEEAKLFWQKTTDTVEELSKGAVDLDDWVAEAHKKADLLKKAATKYAKEKKKYIKEAEGVAKKGVKKAKKVAKKAKTTAKKVKKTVKKATPKKKAAPKKKAPAKKKTTPKKKAAPKKKPTTKKKK